MKRSNLYPREYRYIGFLGIWLLISYLLFTWNFPMTDTVESNYALTALTMMEHNNYISPMIYDVYWYDKPIWTYWMLIASFKLFGVSDFAARFPFAICAMLNGLVMYLGVRTLFKRVRLALWSAIILGTSLEFWYISHAVLTDGFLFLFTQGIFFFAYKGFQLQSQKQFTFAYICAALAVLTKGPIGLILPGLILLLYVLLFNRKKENLALLFAPLGLLAFSIVALPWYVVMYNIHGMNFIDEFLGLHNYVRATIPEHPEQNWWYLYFLIAPVSIFPWTGLTVYELVQIIRHKESRHWTAYALTWGLGVFIFYNLMATKYLTYTFLCLIPFAVITAQGGLRLCGVHGQGSTDEESIPSTHAANVKLIAKLLFIPLLAITTPGLIILVYTLASEPTMTSPMPDNLWHAVFVILVALSLLLLPLVASYRRHSVKNIFAGTAISISLFYLVLLNLLPPLVQQASTKELAQILPLEASTQVYYYRDYRTSLVYYSGHPVTQIIAPEAENDLWSEGKNVMPTTTIEGAVEKTANESDYIILVPNKYNSNFTATALAPRTYEWGRLGNIIIYMAK
ncbi:glycosyltransferase family 39 protein [uncultured Veillonella sp.]|uniref:ArnT family glycosyltransferase n=1 Tax=uncultured Veillonella sp. TaxID=159268 RepID=UPI0025DE9ADC|nr:glycosyltransferase family 39 protein [uncultured Veillonella sp.]MDY3973076.1 glycosyltransferase family 39 protein [Veillonella caviae]